MATKSRSSIAAARPSPRRQVTLVAPIAAVGEVVATGDFTGWSTEGVQLQRRRDGAWSATLKLTPGEYQYRLLVDGHWQNNPAAERHAANPFGSENDVLVVS